jgi:hypothetical protein
MFGLAGDMEPPTSDEWDEVESLQVKMKKR